MLSENRRVDVVVVGCGNAALCAALSARENGANVVVLEKSPEAWRGGNSAFSGGNLRFAFNDVKDIYELVPDLSDSEKAGMEVIPYTHENFFDDLARLTEFQTDGELASTLIENSFSTLKWMRTKGVRMILTKGQSASSKGGKRRFKGGLFLEVVGGGRGLVDYLLDRAIDEGVEIRYASKATRLLRDTNGAISGVEVHGEDGPYEIHAPSVVLASGGFEANPEIRCRYLGPGWDLAKVRGTPYNTGDGLGMAMEIGVQPYGHWSGCSAVSWDLNAPPHGNISAPEPYQRNGYPIGIVVNAMGNRFFDEGSDFQNYTNSKYGKQIMAQSMRTAFQIFDRKTIDLLGDAYRSRKATMVEANTLEELAKNLEIDVEGFVDTVQSFNAAVLPGEFNTDIKDGKATQGIHPPKSNWALPIDEPPYWGFSVTSGITFTFGGVRVNTKGQVLNTENNIIPGLFAAGELVGGIFFFDYPNGAGLVSGAVYGRLSGLGAAKYASNGAS